MAASDVKVPDIGDFSDVPVVAILVSPGDEVAAEDPLIELESDKAAMEVPSPGAGRIAEIKVKEGDTVSQGDVIMTMEAAEEGEASGEEAEDESQAPDAEDKREAEADKTPAREAEAKAPAREAAQGGDRHGRLADVDEAGFRAAHASPSVRKFARELGVDLSGIEGRGRKGRILREDVTVAYKRETAGGAAAPASGGGIPPVPEVDFSKFGPTEDVEMSRIKRISGPALHRSWLNVPHVTHNEEADITGLDAWRRELDAQAKEEGYRVTLLSFMIKACVAALKRHWEVNASIHPDGDKLIRKHYHHIGFAADTPQGLMVPVIRDADAKGIVEISKDLGDLSSRAREGKLKSEEMQGASFTISSLGGIGGTSFTPIVNAPEVAILGLTRAKTQPVWDRESESFRPRLIQTLSLSYDHRAIDGALAARFCATLADLLGDERRLLL